VAAVAEKTGGKPIEIWFGDEARIGQKNKIAELGLREMIARGRYRASCIL